MIRHFTRLSTWNFAIDLGLYPLGSCTMKYNPRLNEFVARLDGLAQAHPYQPEALSQGCMRIQQQLEHFLAEITGMDAVTLQPAAGAQGELTGILLIRAYLDSQGDRARKCSCPIPRTAPIPATATIAGYEVEEIRSNERGMVDLKELDRYVDDTRGRADGHQPEHAGQSSRKRSRRSPSCCMLAARSFTWTAPT